MRSGPNIRSPPVTVAATTPAIKPTAMTPPRTRANARLETITASM